MFGGEEDKIFGPVYKPVPYTNRTVYLGLAVLAAELNPFGSVHLSFHPFPNVMTSLR
jgi:hypothetical protein